ncbi:MAG TPA: N-acetylmuramoyl-L-alanine amidase, partial [Dokdonella sp.]
DLSQGATMAASNEVADKVLRSLRKLGPTHRNYVERANFIVLRSPDVPSILVETAFITNPAEEARLKDQAHRRKLAGAILEGIDAYFRETPPPGTLFAQQAERSRSTASRYVVNRGDTLSAIAQTHGVSTSALRAANQLADERVRAGDVLQIPSG